MSDLRNQDNAQLLRDLLPAYRLGITDPDDTRLVEALLPQYPEIATEADVYDEIAGAMLKSVPQKAPPPQLLNKILAQAQPAPTLRQIGFSWRERLILFSAAAAFMLMLAFCTYLLITLAQTQQQLESRDELLARFANDDVFEFQLVDADGNPGGMVLCHPSERLVVVRAMSLPTDQQREYRVWLWQDDERTDGGLLRVDPGGAGTLVIQAPQQMGDYQYLAIAPENGEGGPVARAALYNNDA